MGENSYKSSRVCYVLEASIEYFISIMITGAYLAKLTQELGFSDSLTAVLTAFVSLGCSFQMLALAFFKRGRVKRRVTIMHIINQLLFMLIYVVPFFDIGKTAKTVSFVLLLLGGYFISNIIFSPKTSWFISLVDDHKRGIFTSIKEIVSLVGGLCFQLLMGRILDIYEESGNIRGYFIFAASTIFVLMLMHTATLIFCKEPEPTKEANSTVPFSKRFLAIIKNKNIMTVISVCSLWAIANQMLISYTGTYQVKELGFSMTFVAFLSVGYSAVRIPVSIVLGKYADRKSFAKMLRICYIIAAFCYLFAVFTIPSNGKVFFTAYFLLYAAAMGGVNSADTNLIFDYAKPEERSDALAVKQTIYGICGFLSTIAIAPLVNHIQKSGNTFLGLHLYAQQVIALISFLIICFLLIYISKTLIAKKKQ